MIRASVLPALPCCQCAGNTGKGGVFPVGSGNIAGIGRVEKASQKRLCMKRTLKDDWDYIQQRGCRNGLLCTSGPWPWPRVLYTLAGSAWSSRESLIMECMKHKTKNFTAMDCSLIAYPEFLFSLRAVRLAFHILGCHVLENVGPASQPVLLNRYSDHLGEWNLLLGL